jgi:hypothetical protein
MDLPYKMTYMDLTPATDGLARTLHRLSLSVFKQSWEGSVSWGELATLQQWPASSDRLCVTRASRPHSFKQLHRITRCTTMKGRAAQFGAPACSVLALIPNKLS